MTATQNNNRCPNCGGPLKPGVLPFNCEYCGVQKTAPVKAQPVEEPKPTPQKIKTNAGWYFLFSMLAALVTELTTKDGAIYNFLMAASGFIFFICLGSLIWYAMRKLWHLFK